MLRINRSRVIGILCLTLFIYYLVVSDSASTTDFRKKTEAGLVRRNTLMQGTLTDEEYTRQTSERLERILASQPNMGTMEVGTDDDPKHNVPSTEDLRAQGMSREEPQVDRKHRPMDSEDEIPIAGRKMMPKPKVKDTDKPKYSKDDHAEEVSTADDPGKDRAREKLSEHLKNPIVIFSKSYCPHSRRAKELLLNVYSITPTPQVVELDQLTERLPGEDSATMGAKMQELLKEITGRRTVPNIIVGGLHSIGGNDMIWEMHENGLLGAELQKYGGKRITSIDLRENHSSKKEVEGDHGLKS